MQQQFWHPNPALIAGFMLFGLLANVAMWKTVSEVNSHLPEAQRFSWWWWTLTKQMKVWNEHKRLCPNSHWRLYSALSFLLAVVFMILIATSVQGPKPV